MNEFVITDDKSKLDIELIHAFLTNSYWAKGRSLEKVELSIMNSDCYGIYMGENQIGFARIVTDLVTIAYLLDVFILEEHRGKGYSKKLLAAIFENPKYRTVQKWRLASKDAQSLYAKFGFTPVTSHKNQMEKITKPA